MKTSTRLLIIVHLSLVFSYLAWACLKPPLDEYYESQTLTVLYESIGTTPPETESIGWIARTTDSLYLLAIGIPPYGQTWALFSILTCLFFLFRIRGAAQAVWLLPLLSILYSVDNYQHGGPPRPTADAHLFPSEQNLEQYLEEPLSDSISEQYEQLKVAWGLYLVDEWGGEAAFTKARIAALEAAPPYDPLLTLRQKEPIPYHVAYLAWNLLFAFRTFSTERPDHRDKNNG